MLSASLVTSAGNCASAVSKITCRERWLAVRGIALRLTITTSAQDGSATSARTTAAPTCPVPPMIKTRNAILGLVCKLTEKASVIGAHPLLNEPAMIVKTEDILQVQMTRWLFGGKDPAGECVNSRTNLPFDPRLTGNIIALGNDYTSASLSKRTGFVNSDPQVRTFPWDVLKTIQEEVYSFTKLTGRLLMEVA